MSRTEEPETRTIRVDSLLVSLVLAVCLAAGGCTRSLDAVTRVVVVTLDTTRADHLGCYGYGGGTTPNLDRFAAESVVFDQAVSQVPTTLPSHSTMFTGLYPQDHGVRRNMVFRLGPNSETLAEMFAALDFATAGFPASFILSQRFGIDQGFQEYPEPPGPRQGGAPDPEAIYRLAEDGVDLALEWLEGHSEEPFFLWLHFYDPHAPYRPPFPFSSRFADRPYDGEIAYADAQFGRFLERLRQDPKWDETLVVVAGDHGEGLHEHNERYHAFLLYETTQRVPLIVRAPGARPRRVEVPVSLADLMPTVLDLAGQAVPEGIRGRSLRPALEGRKLPVQDLYFETLAGALNYGWDELRGIRDGRWKLIDSGSPELYDLQEDPYEQINLASTEADRLEELRVALANISEPIQESHAEAAHDPVMDPGTEALLASLGYVGSSAGGSSSAEAPHPTEMIDMTSEILRSQREVALGNWPSVEELANYVLMRDPGNKWALANKINALILLGRAGEAQDVGAEFVRRYPDNGRAYEMFARSFHAAGRPEKAHEVLQTGLKALPGNDSLVYLSLVAAFDMNSPSVCTSELSASLAERPDSPRLLVLKARCEARDGDPESAFRTLTAAVKLGFRDVALLREAEDFGEVVTHSRFEELVRIVEQAGQAEF